MAADSKDAILSTTVFNRSGSSSRLFGLLVLVLIAAALPLLVLNVYVLRALDGKSLAIISNEEMAYYPNVTNGEVWLTVRKKLSPPPQEKIEYRISRVNLKTGQTREIGPVMKIKDDFWPLCSTREIYGINQKTVYQWDGAQYQRLAMRPNSPDFISVPFDYDGKLSMIVETQDEGFRLIHASEGQWIDGPRIVLPRIGWVWRDDPIDGQSNIIEPENLKFAARDTRWISAMQFDEATHVFITGLSGFAAYRSGFQFVDQQTVAVDEQTVAPTKTPPSGWERIQPIKSGDSWYGMNCDRHGAFFVSRRNPHRIVRRYSEKNWGDVTGFEDEKFNSLPLTLVDRAEGITYLMNRNSSWESAEISRIDDNKAGPTESRLKGFVPEYLRRWHQLATGVIVAWALHVGLLILGTIAIKQDRGSEVYEFGGNLASLASIGQRASALIIDLLIGLVLFLTLIAVEMKFLGIHRRSLTNQQVAESLLLLAGMIENNFNRGGSTLLTKLPQILQTFFESHIQSLPRVENCFSVLVMDALAIFVMRLICQARWGATPGQWLTGIRTLRSTLRPPGIARRIVRDLMYWFDIPFLLTPILGTISVVLSTERKRWGDRVADTVVVRITNSPIASDGVISTIQGTPEVP